MIVKTSISFVDSVYEMLGGLLQGSKTVIVPTDDAVSGIGVFFSLLRRYSITRLVCVPTLLFTALNSKRWTEAELRSFLCSLHVLTLSGEPCSTATVKQLRQIIPECELVLQCSYTLHPNSIHQRTTLWISYFKLLWLNFSGAN